MDELPSKRCEECPLHARFLEGDKYFQPIHGEMVENGTGEKIKSVFVGIHPGHEEALDKRVFTGRSGRILRHVASNLDFGTYFLTNVCLCPWTEEVTKQEEREALECCKEHLLSELESLSPDLVIALGNIPFTSISGEHIPITSIAGRVFHKSVYNLPYDLLAVEHPAAILHNEENYGRTEGYRDFVDSMESGERWHSGTYVQGFVPKVHVIVPDDDPLTPFSESKDLRAIHLSDFLNQLSNVVNDGQPISNDTETTKDGFYPYSYEPDKIRSIGLGWDKRNAFIIPGYNSPYYPEHPNFVGDPNLRYLLVRAKNIFHNAIFDAGFYWAEGIPLSIYYDTFLAHYWTDEREFSHGLKKLAIKFLGVADWESDLSQYLPGKKASYDHIPDDVLYWYQGHDVTYTYQLFDEILKQKIPPTGEDTYSRLLIPCANMFTELRHLGYPISPKAFLDLDRSLEEEYERAEKELWDIVGSPMNPASPPEVAAYIYDELKLPVLPYFGRSTGKKALDYYKQFTPVVEKIIECRHLLKMKGTYLDGLAKFIDDNWRIHPSFKLHAAVTGRISTEDPSLMNVLKSKGVKSLYLPEPGCLLAEADQKQMELRWYVVVAQDKILGDIIRSGGDPHQLVGDKASELVGKPIKRGTAKTAVFGRLYGRQIESFIREYKFPREDALTLLNTIDSMFPGIKKYNMDVKEELKRGYVTSYFNRRRRFGLITEKNKSEVFRQAVNDKIQSPASDTNLFVMLHLFGLWKRGESPIKPMWPVHDSILCSIPDESYIPFLRKEIETYSKELVKGAMDFKVEIKVGSNWGNAEEIKDD